MGNSASVTVNGITLSLADAAKIGDMPEVKAYREQQAKEAEERRIKVGDMVWHKKTKSFLLVSEVNTCTVHDGDGNGWQITNCVKPTPDEIATLNRIAERMGE